MLILFLKHCLKNNSTELSTLARETKVNMRSLLLNMPELNTVILITTSKPTNTVAFDVPSSPTSLELAVGRLDGAPNTKNRYHNRA